MLETPLFPAIFEHFKYFAALKIAKHTLQFLKCSKPRFFQQFSSILKIAKCVLQFLTRVLTHFPTLSNAR